MRELDKRQCCCFTGHRPDRFQFKYNENAALCKAIKAALYEMAKKLYEEMGVKRFWSGGALGVDVWAAEAILELKKLHDDAELYLALPFPGYFDPWRKENIERIRGIIARCDHCEPISPEIFPDAPQAVKAAAYKRRNYFMVDRCLYLIAIFDRDKSIAERSGTIQTVNYAKKKQAQIFYIHPDTVEVTLG